MSHLEQAKEGSEITVNKHIRAVKECINKSSSEKRNMNENKNKADDNKKQNIHLPKIKIKKFSGDSTKWQAFIDSFTCAIYENKYISNVEK